MPPPNNGTTTKEASSAPVMRFRFAVEFGDDKNRVFDWPPDQSKIRGWFKRSNLVNVSFDENFATMPDLPGMVLEVDAEKRTARFYDPLSLPKFKKILDTASAVNLATFGQSAQPHPERKFANLTDSQLKELVYWTRRLVDVNRAHVLGSQNRVPDMAEIEDMSGVVRVGVHDHNRHTEKRPRTPYMKPEFEESPQVTV